MIGAQAGRVRPYDGAQIKVLSTTVTYHIKWTIAWACCVSEWLGAKRRSFKMTSQFLEAVAPDITHGAFWGRQ